MSKQKVSSMDPRHLRLDPNATLVRKGGRDAVCALVALPSFPATSIVPAGENNRTRHALRPRGQV